MIAKFVSFGNGSLLSSVNDALGKETPEEMKSARTNVALGRGRHIDEAVISRRLCVQH